MGLRRDLDLLADRKKQLLRRGVEEELSRVADEEARQREETLNAQVQDAKLKVRDAINSSRVEYETILDEIDEHLAVLDGIRSVVQLRRDEHAVVREQCASVLVAWVADAKAAHKERLARRVASEKQWVHDHAADCLPDGFFPSWEHVSRTDARDNR